MKIRFPTIVRYVLEEFYKTYDYHKDYKEAEKKFVETLSKEQYQEFLKFKDAQETEFVKEDQHLVDFYTSFANGTRHIYDAQNKKDDQI